MTLPQDFNDARRRFLLGLGAGFGWLTAADLLGTPVWAQQGPRSGATPFSRGVLQMPHYPPKAKRVIYMHMLGAVSQADTFDYKPVLEKMHGQELPASVRGNMRLSTMVQGQTSFPVVGPLAKFLPGGQSGAMVSDLMPHTRKIADDICIIRTMHTEHVNHDPASKFLHTGFQIAGRPSAGAWINYALGSNNQDLPAFIVMSSGQSNGVPIDAAAWGPGFIPSHYQGVLFRSGQTPVPYIANPDGLTQKDRRDMLDAIADVAGMQHKIRTTPRSHRS